METGENDKIELPAFCELLRRSEDPLVSFRSFCFTEAFLDTVRTLPDSGRDRDCLRPFTNFVLSLRLMFASCVSVPSSVLVGVPYPLVMPLVCTTLTPLWRKSNLSSSYSTLSRPSHGLVSSRTSRIST